MSRGIIAACCASMLVGCAAIQPLAFPARSAKSPAIATSPSLANSTPTQNHIVIRKRNGTTVSLAVEVADTAEAQATGLSGRTTLAPDAGMLFVFPSAEPIEFWMHDTPIPLSIAFVDDRRTIIDVQEMQPETDDHHVPPGPIRYAIEANRGYFSGAGVTIGDKVEFGKVLTSGSASPR